MILSIVVPGSSCDGYPLPTQTALPSSQNRGNDCAGGGGKEGNTTSWGGTEAGSRLSAMRSSYTSSSTIRIFFRGLGVGKYSVSFPHAIIRLTTSRDYLALFEENLLEGNE